MKDEIGLKSRILSFAAITLFFSIAPARAATTDLVLLAPLDGSFVENRSVSVVASVKEHAVEGIRISVNGVQQPVLFKPGRKVVCYGGVNLSSGENRITVAGLMGGKVIEQKTIVIFSVGGFVSEYGAAHGNKKYVFHAAANEKLCSSCHPMDFSEPKGAPLPPGSSPCIGCHGKMLAGYRYIHGPAAVWACSMCHHRQSARQEASALQGDDQSCSGCHAETLGGWKTKKYRHGPTDAGLCVICHNPHGSNFPFFVRMNTTQLCNSCHAKKILQPHVITGFTRNGHPLRVDANEARLGMTLTCASCHNPHAGDNPRFLIGYKGSQTDFCMRCHKF